jgi:hypothetical protein
MANAGGAADFRHGRAAVLLPTFGPPPGRFGPRELELEGDHELKHGAEDAHGGPRAQGFDTRPARPLEDFAR